jgi:hypothetical protein
VRVAATTSLALLALAAAAAAFAAKAPTYHVAFTGSGTQHHVDIQRYIEDSGACNARENVDQTATFSWSGAWTGLTTARAGAAAGAPTTAGSTVAGGDVKDACGLALDAAPADWPAQSSCNDALQVIAPAAIAIERRTKTALVLAVSAPTYVVPVASTCNSLNIRGDQLAAHVSVPLAALSKLARGKTVSYAVGTAHPGPGDAYAPKLVCSQPAKPYEGYRIADECLDELSWSGTVTITRSS